MSKRNIPLAEFVDIYANYVSMADYAAATKETYIRLTKQFAKYTGPIQLRSVTVRHIDSYMMHRQERGLSVSSLNSDLAALRNMFKYAFTRQYLPATALNPVAHCSNYKDRNTAAPKLRLPASKFPELLDQSIHPRDRIVNAIGLYLCLRQGEIRRIRIQHVRLDAGEIDVIVTKTVQDDAAKTMTIPLELDRELRRWLTFYTNECGPLQPSWFLAPAKSKGGFRGENPHLNPTISLCQPERIPQAALARMGYELRDDAGKPSRDGIHTLRRSGARALFDRLSKEGYDGAGRVAQTLLHHAHFHTTEKYLGIDLDQKRLDDIMRGKEMFPVQHDASVIDLEQKRQEKKDGS